MLLPQKYTWPAVGTARFALAWCPLLQQAVWQRMLPLFLFAVALLTCKKQRGNKGDWIVVYMPTLLADSFTCELHE